MKTTIHDDPFMAYAIQNIYGDFRDKVSVTSKNKALTKFGTTPNADDGIKTTVAQFGSAGTVNVNETYSTTNDIDSVVSSSADDTEEIRIEGHKIEADGSLAFIVQYVTLTGQTPVSLDTSLARATRAKVKDGTFASPSGDLVGDVYIYVSGNTVTNGVPQTSADVKLRIVAGRNQSEKAATSISSTDYWIITSARVSVRKGNASTVAADFQIETRKIGGVFLPVGIVIAVRSGGAQAGPVYFKPYVVVPKNSDVRLVAISNAANSECSGYMSGVLAEIV